VERALFGWRIGATEVDRELQEERVRATRHVGPLGERAEHPELNRRGRQQMPRHADERDGSGRHAHRAGDARARGVDPSRVARAQSGVPPATQQSELARANVVQL
jgi:hypothetical protein